MSTLGYDYGGWIDDRSVLTTSSTPTKVRLLGWMMSTGVLISGIGTGGELSAAYLQSTQSNYSATYNATEVARTSAENLEHIREVLKPAISDLATTLNVSRQSIYNWLNGAPVADVNASKLDDLAKASDVLAQAGVTVNPALLKRKLPGGKTLLEIAKDGESARDAAIILVEIYQREAAQREQMNARFANRVNKPASADFDLPHSDHQA